MNRFRGATIGFALLLGLVVSQSSAADTIYLRNRLYNGRVIHDAKGTPLLEVKEFVKAAGIYPGDVVCTPPYHGTIKLAYQGHTYTLPVPEASPDGVYVPAESLVEALGGRWNPNPTLGVVDVYLPPVQKVASSGPPNTILVSTEGPPSPIRVDSFTYYDPTLPGNYTNVQVRGTLVAENTGDNYVDGVTLVIHFQDGYGKDLATVDKSVGRLEPGQRTQWDWLWNNAALANFHPLAEVVCAPYLSQADLKQKKTPGTEKLRVLSAPTSGTPASAPAEGGAATDTNAPTTPSSQPTTAPGMDPNASPSPANPPGY